MRRPKKICQNNIYTQENSMKWNNNMAAII